MSIRLMLAREPFFAVLYGYDEVRDTLFAQVREARLDGTKTFRHSGWDSLTGLPVPARSRRSFGLGQTSAPIGSDRSNMTAPKR